MGYFKAGDLAVTKFNLTKDSKRHELVEIYGVEDVHVFNDFSPQLLRLTKDPYQTPQWFCKNFMKVPNTKLVRILFGEK